MMHGVLGIVLALDLIKLPHWDLDAFHDVILIRRCMPRDMFFLTYCGFLHMPATSPKRHNDGSYDKGLDALWHLR